MDVRVVSQREFDQIMNSREITDRTVDRLSKTFFISIIDTSGRSHFKTNHDNVLVMKFDDLTDTEWDRIAPATQKGLNLFNEKHAKQIVDFLEKNKGKDYCMVHCAAGVSRSGAVGTFINDFYSKVDYFTFMSRNKYVKPNAYVLTTLKKVYYESDSSGQ